MIYCSSRVRTRAICDLISCTARMLGIQRADSSVAVRLTPASCTIENTPTAVVSISTEANARPSLVASRRSCSHFIVYPCCVFLSERARALPWQGGRVAVNAGPAARSASGGQLGHQAHVVRRHQAVDVDQHQHALVDGTQADQVVGADGAAHV